jgi:nucleotide-binding universal stress UspA family protein
MDDQQEQLDQVAMSVLSLGVHAQTRLLEGEPFVEIIRDVIRNQRDLVVMTMDNQLGWREYFFGNTISALIRDCPCPILALKPMKHKCFRRILVAVDPVLVGDSHDTLNSLLLELASTLAELESAELHIVHAWRLVGESMMRGRFAIPEADIDNAAKLEFERRRGLLEGVLRKHSITSNQVHLPKGDPIPAITDLVKDLEVDLLVMGTVCRTGIPGFIIGNTAEQILAKVECSTLTVKPLGFVSPVTL